MIDTLGTQKITAVEAAKSLLKNNIATEMNPLHIAKIPVQERGITRFNEIIKVAEKLVIENGIDRVSHYSIAKAAKIPPSSVYQYFPSMASLFAVMAEKHFIGAFYLTPELIAKIQVKSWKDLALVIVQSAYNFYSKDKISEILFLNVFLSAGVKEYSLSRITRLGIWFKQYFAVLYRNSDIEGLEEKLSISLDITKAIFIRSIGMHGEIKEQYIQDAKITVLSYLGEFFKNIE